MKGQRYCDVSRLETYFVVKIYIQGILANAGNSLVKVKRFREAHAVSKTGQRDNLRRALSPARQPARLRGELRRQNRLMVST